MSDLGIPELDPWSFSFPLKDSLRGGESGQGYALRMAGENGLSGLPLLKRWLGKSQFATLDSVDAPLVGHWFGAHLSELEDALGLTSIGRNEGGYFYGGHSIGRSYFINRMYPRICHECLKEDGYCRLSWDFSLVTACNRHGVTLVERCFDCDRAFSWNRNTIGVCSCGCALGSGCSLEDAESVELEFAFWAEERLNTPTATASWKFMNGGGGTSTDLTPLMTLLTPLSLNGGLQIAYGLGAAATYEVKIAAASTCPRSPLRKSRNILAMANQLARKLIQHEPLQFRVNRPSAVVALLADSASAQMISADRGLSQSILNAVLQNKSMVNWRGTHPQLSQLTIF